MKCNNKLLSVSAAPTVILTTVDGDVITIDKIYFLFCFIMAIAVWTLIMKIAKWNGKKEK